MGWTRRMGVIALTLLAFWLALVALLYLFQRQIQYRPPAMAATLDSASLPGLADLPLTADDGLATRSWVRLPPPGGRVVVYLHGNASHMNAIGHKARTAADLGFGVLLLGYRGYSGNPGSPTEQGLYADTRAALNWLAAQGIGPERVILYGESLGTGVAVQIASERPVAAVVLEAPFTSVTDVAARQYPFVPVRPLLKDHFDSRAKIGRVSAPLLVIHGERDGVVPFKLGQRLFEAANQPKRFQAFPQAGHNDLYDHGAAQVVAEFLRPHTQESPHPPR